MFRQLLLAAIAASPLLMCAPADARVIIRPPQPDGQWVWVEPVYTVTYEKVWIPERIERIPHRYYVSPTYGWRTIITYDCYGNRVETREWGQISPGHWETSYREVVVAGHYEMRERRILVSSGYWKYIGPRPLPVDPPIVIQPAPSPRTVGVEGYAKEWEQDKGKFSPLHEWPK